MNIMNHKFVIENNKKLLNETWKCLIILGALIILVSVICTIAEGKFLFVAYAWFLVLWLGLFIFWFRQNLFRIVVNGKTVCVRKRSGIKYSFDIKDITKVKVFRCDCKANDKFLLKPVERMIIYAKHKKLVLDSSWDNYQCMIQFVNDEVPSDKIFVVPNKIANFGNQINDSAYGGFIVSKNVINGRPIRYTYREKSSVSQLNGWTIYSCDDDQEYVTDSNNFVIIGATSIYKIAPVMLEIFDAPYGTDLCWMYEGNTHIGFYDLAKDRDTTIDEILHQDK